VRLQEGVLTSSDYLARDTELLQARIAQATHQVELAQARARVLTTIGAEVR
jgi:outer membrane protein TolC